MRCKLHCKHTPHVLYSNTHIVLSAAFYSEKGNEMQYKLHTYNITTSTSVKDRWLCRDINNYGSMDYAFG